MSRKPFRRFLGIALLLTLICCNEKPLASPTDEAKGVLVSALEALNNNDIDGYLSMAVTGSAATDSAATNDAVRRALSLHVARMQAELPPVASIAVVDAKMHGDSLCTVYFQYTFTDSTKEVSAQRMKRVAGTWKLLLRD